jgi:prefoldin beta subunit|tara:strand:- start:643 stop:972 length:330 start_codon:yes stop_codon:yes gene_type:complete
MDIDNETQQKIQELQGYEQNLQQIMMQKQAFQMELGETDNALGELEKANDEVFKMIGNIMIKTDKTKTLEDLKKKKELLNLRLKSIETQESDLTKQAEELKAEVMKKIK